MKKWQIGCGALAVITIVVVVAAGWWVYGEFRIHQVEIRNESAETIYVHGEPLDVCPAILIAAGTTVAYRDGRLLCKRPSITFSFIDMEDIGCSWTEAQRTQPVIVRRDFISCHGAIPTFVSPPWATSISTSVSTPRAYPTPTPDR
jgi:hypothetical protein